MRRRGTYPRIQIFSSFDPNKEVQRELNATPMAAALGTFSCIAAVLCSASVPVLLLLLLVVVVVSWEGML